MRSRVRRVVAGRRVGRHAHQLLQEAHLLVEVGVDPGVEAVVVGSWRSSGLRGELFEQCLEGLHGQVHVVRRCSIRAGCG